MVAMKVLENLGWILTCTSGFAILIIFSAMAADVGLSNIFCWHPILLSMAFLLYMNEGLLVYFNNNNKTDRAVYIYFGGILNICIAAIFWNSESWRGIVRFIVILTALSLALITLWIKRNGGILLSNDDEIDQENEYETVSLNDSTL